MTRLFCHQVSDSISALVTNSQKSKGFPFDIRGLDDAKNPGRLYACSRSYTRESKFHFESRNQNPRRPGGESNFQSHSQEPDSREIKGNGLTSTEGTSSLFPTDTSIREATLPSSYPLFKFASLTTSAPKPRFSFFFSFPNLGLTVRREPGA